MKLKKRYSYTPGISVFLSAEPALPPRQNAAMLGHAEQDIPPRTVDSQAGTVSAGDPGAACENAQPELRRCRSGWEEEHAVRREAQARAEEQVASLRTK